MVKNYIPRQKDVVLISLDSAKGHEQHGYRPAVIISNDAFNKFTKMAVVLPITSNSKDFPTHYLLKNSTKIKGSVLCEHVRSIDYINRNAKYVETLTDEDFISMYTLFLACLEN